MLFHNRYEVSVFVLVICGLCWCVQVLKRTKSLRRRVLEDLAPGRVYCVSVRFSDSLLSRESSYSQPQCASTSSINTAGTGRCVSVHVLSLADYDKFLIILYHS